MNRALVSLMHEINEAEREAHPEPILITESVLKEITNGMALRAFCTTHGVSATREQQIMKDNHGQPRKKHEYIALTPRKDQQLTDRL